MVRLLLGWSPHACLRCLGACGWRGARGSWHLSSLVATRWFVVLPRCSSLTAGTGATHHIGSFCLLPGALTSAVPDPGTFLPRIPWLSLRFLCLSMHRLPHQRSPPSYHIESGTDPPSPPLSRCSCWGVHRFSSRLETKLQGFFTPEGCPADMKHSWVLVE